MRTEKHIVIQCQCCGTKTKGPGLSHSGQDAQSPNTYAATFFNKAKRLRYHWCHVCSSVMIMSSVVRIESFGQDCENDSFLTFSS